jgi:hypothetical protein
MYEPYVNYIGLINSGFDGVVVDHNLFTDPNGWYSGIASGSPFTNPAVYDANGVSRTATKGGLVQNNLIQDISSGHYMADSPTAHYDWSAINFWCQTQTLNGALTQGNSLTVLCNAAHTTGGFTRNLLNGVSYTNSDLCTVAILGSGGATTCDTGNADGDHGFGAYPNDNFNSVAFSSITFRQASPSNTAQPDYAMKFNPSSPQAMISNANCPGTIAAGCKLGNDNRPLGVDMSQMNFIRLTGGAPVVSDRAAIFSINVSQALQGQQGMLIVASDPFCFNPIADMDPARYTNPGWTGNDAYPVIAGNRKVVVGLNTALSASTTYYYCLHFGGYEIDGSFTTASTLIGSTVQTVSFSPPSNLRGGTGADNLVVVYGPSYSRATDTIGSSTTTAAVSCTLGGGVCLRTFSPSAGVPLYWRWQLRDSMNAVLVQSPVTVTLPQ